MRGVFEWEGATRPPSLDQFSKGLAFKRIPRSRNSQFSSNPFSEIHRILFVDFVELKLILLFYEFSENKQTLHAIFKLLWVYIIKPSYRICLRS